MLRPAHPLGATLGRPPFSGRFPRFDLSPIDLDAEEKRQRMVARRYERFFGDTGLVEKFEHRGDRLIEMQHVAVLVASRDLPKVQVIERFVTSVTLGCFPVPGAGFRDYGDRDAVRDLIDLHNFNRFTAGQYALRPSALTVARMPAAMRARRSTWVCWINALGLPVPSELQDVPPVATATPATPPPATPPPLGMNELQALYDARVTTAYAPTWEEDRSWARQPSLKARGVILKNVEQARANNPDKRLHTRHRR